MHSFWGLFVDDFLAVLGQEGIEVVVPVVEEIEVEEAEHAVVEDGVWGALCGGGPGALRNRGKVGGYFEGVEDGPGVFEPGALSVGGGVEDAGDGLLSQGDGGFGEWSDPGGGDELVVDDFEGRAFEGVAEHGADEVVAALGIEATGANDVGFGVVLEREDFALAFAAAVDRAGIGGLGFVDGVGKAVAENVIGGEMDESCAVFAASCSKCCGCEGVGAEGVVGVGFGGVDGVVSRGVVDCADAGVAGDKFGDRGRVGDVELFAGDAERGDILCTKLREQFVA